MPPPKRPPMPPRMVWMRLSFQLMISPIVLLALCPCWGWVEATPLPPRCLVRASAWLRTPATITRTSKLTLGLMVTLLLLLFVVTRSD